MPVESATLAAFVIAAGVIVISPGPDTMLILRHSLVSGRRVGLAAVLGTQIGIAGHTLLTVVGISLLIASSPLLFRTVGIVGALYLGWLGVQALAGRGAASLGDGGKPTGALRALRQATLTNLLNPKVILIFLALFPNFVDQTRGDTTAQLLTLALTLLILNVLWQAPIPLVAEPLRKLLTAPRARWLIERGTGAVLLGFGLAMLYEQVG